MDVYKFPEHGNANANMIQGTTDPNSQLTNPLIEPFETMYNEGGPEYIVDQGMYYPSATNYGYICTGLESLGDWDDHHRVFGMDGQNIQFIGTQTENSPYVYYTPSYGYTQSPYNPYNPYIPGAMIGSDGSFLTPQQYYIPNYYENTPSSPAYFPMVIQPGLDTFTSGTNTADSSGVNSNLSGEFGNGKEGFESNGGPNKLNVNNEGRGGQAINNLSNWKNLSNNERVIVDKVRKITNDVNGNSNALVEQNRGPRTTTSNTRLTVKAYSTRAGNSDAHGNIIISMDQYNKEDFFVEYMNAKFFVIKSYSEDDVHKSIKYKVWSSTPNGNKKLNNAYEEALKISVGDSKGCPVFLFFSVNASGQFCGVAEMTGHVDFHKDMDFWQQDKWSGSFPLTWHIIKDVPNHHFRHIILENNEHKPVTNSRDTQEIIYKKGVEMLKIFKNYASKTSLLDDFMYYENRQKILQEEKARLLIKSNGTPAFGSVLHPPRKLNNFFGSNGSDVNTSNSNLQSVANNDGKLSEDAVLHFRSLAITPKRIETTESDNVLTVGSIPVKVNGFNESSGVLTVGTIPLDLKALEAKEG